MARLIRVKSKYKDIIINIDNVDFIEVDGNAIFFTMNNKEIGISFDKEEGEDIKAEEVYNNIIKEIGIIKL